jgi:hypothetical protein
LLFFLPVSVYSDLSELHDNTLGSATSISSYTSSSNPFVFPSDGYIVVYATPNNTAQVNVGSMEVICSGTSAYQTQNVSVRKGMSAYVVSLGTSCDVVFIPFT